MKYQFTLLLIIIFIGCRQRMTQQDIENELNKSMQNFLYESVNNDSSHIKYRIQDVTYFEDKAVYRCEFHVRMLTPENGKDTIGLMGADISKDFKNVARKF